MNTSDKKIDLILEEVLDETKQYQSKLSISPYGSQGKKYLYLYQIKKNNGGM
ncbi:MAG: hypothetical protein ACFFDN_24160 [Candidatus Hodarchaeota archaeon]